MVWLVITMKGICFLRSVGVSLFLCGMSNAVAQRKECILSGYVKDTQTGHALSGVAVSAQGRGTLSDANGYYALSLPSDSLIQLAYTLLGYRSRTVQLRLRQDARQEVSLSPEDQKLREVIVKSTASSPDQVSESVQMSRNFIPIEQIQEIPALLGEKDVVKSLQLMPGVQKGSEGSTGMYVRGGGPDQNLVTLDGIPLYHTSHLFGFFSLFNGDAIQSVSLIKGGFPARYGGRLSSVIEMQMKEGDRQNVHVEGGLGLISSRLTVHGPLQKSKSSFLISARRTYADLIIGAVSKGPVDQNGYFYDLNAKLSFDLGPKDYLLVSAYTGRDDFIYTTKGTITKERGKAFWGNAAGTISWKHQFTSRLTLLTSGQFTHYSSQVNLKREISREGQKEKYELENNSFIRDIGLKSDLEWLLGQRHILRSGVQVTSHLFRPGTYADAGGNIPSVSSVAWNSDTWEAAAYLEDTYTPIPRLKINAGFRYSAFRTASNKDYFRPEPRLAIAYTFPRHWAVKASAAEMNQYVHLLQNSGIGFPTDLWIPATARTRPQQSRQLALGLAKDLRSDVFLTVEGFYKTMSRMVAYREGATSLAFSTNGDWEDQLTHGRGWSYGAEFLIQKKKGRFTGWAGYTLSWTQQQFDKLNFGRKFWARYDRRHDLSLVGVYHLNSRITASASWVYGTSPALTLPQGQYWITGSSGLDLLGGEKDYYTSRIFEEYGQRNGFRAPAYQHLDVGLQFHRKKRGFERTWELSIYNLYNYKNPFMYFLDTVNVSGDSKKPKYENRLKQITLFPILPSISYQFKF